MLVLGRKKGEGLMIGHDILVEIVDLSRNKVLIGIQAPPETIILRGEIVNRSPRNNQEGQAEGEQK